MTPLGCGFEDFGLWAGLFIWVSVTKEEKFRLLRKLRTWCKFFIKIRTAGVCFPYKAKDMGAFPWHIRMETAYEFNHDAYFTGGGWFSVFSAVLYCYGVEAVPGVNVGDWGEEGGGTRQSLQQQGRKWRNQPFFGRYLHICFTHMAYWLRTLHHDVEEVHRAFLPSEGKMWDSLVTLPFI